MNPKRVKAIHETRQNGKGITTLNGKQDDKDAEGWGIVGFDTEYNTDEDYTISYQLYATEEQNAFIPGPTKLTIRDIAKRARVLLPKHIRKVLICSYYNTAEFSQTDDDFWNDSKLSIYPAHPSGILHIRGQEPDPLNEGQQFEFFYFDLWHWFASMKNSSLYRVSEMLGFEKREYDVTRLTLRNLNDPKFVEYATHDARLCVEIFNRLDSTFREINGVSIISRATPANAAQASFRRNYLKQDVERPKRPVRNLALRSNWGGRAECGYVGTASDIFEHDADSLYPRATLLLPNLPAAGQWKMGMPDDLERKEGFVDVEFIFDGEERWPCLPVYNQGSLIFPLKGRSCCTFSEIRSAFKREGFKIRHIYSSCWYQEGIHDEFHSFLADNIRLKEQNNDNAAIRAVAKLNMNSAIGKFVQNRGGFDYNLVSSFLREHPNEQKLAALYYGGQVLPDIEWLEDHGREEIADWFNYPVRLGASFYPEWHTLILGKARSVVADAIYDNDSYPDILTISTDAIHIPTSKLPRTTVPFKLEHGPDLFMGFNFRRHLSLDPETFTVRGIAHHGMPMSSRDAAAMMAMSNHDERIRVIVRGMTTAREAIKTGKRFGESKTREMTIDFKPDSKRRLSDSGWTYPWNSIEQMVET
jgi:DNA polymerase type B, organellar and viral